MISNDPIYVCFEGKAFADKQELSGRFYSALQKLVVQQPGFISETPFVSIDQPGAQLLYVKFDSEQHMREWANQRTHLKAQFIGRAQVFSDYRIRIGQSVRDSNEGGGLDGGDSAAAGKYLLVWQYPLSNGNGEGLTQPEVKVDGVSLRHLVDAATYVNESHGLQILAWSSREAATHVEQQILRVIGDEVRIILVGRDYGRFHRKEAPIDADEGQSKAAADEGVVLPMA